MQAARRNLGTFGLVTSVRPALYEIDACTLSISHPSSSCHLAKVLLLSHHSLPSLTFNMYH